ncbi:Mur ligase family protein [Eubacterium aggregans]|uniref:Mur ligase family protein n=2 Tax=Eubacterium aggregans TaxID=81409 RepID=UPI003F346C8D
MEFKITGQAIVDILKANDLFISSDSDFGGKIFQLITFNSKDAQSGTLFICKGMGFKKEYLEDAITHGAEGFLSEEPMSVSVPGVITSNVRRAMALVAKTFYGYQPWAFNLFGVTGTKGKSTTVYYLKNILEYATGKKPAFLTTVDIFDGVEFAEATLTTPEAPTTYAYFAKAVANGCDNVVMELSSQADKMERLVGMEYQYGIYINISDDHIAPNEHQDFEEYLGCKMNIVARYQKAVINLDDAHSDCALKAADGAEQVLTYSVHEDTGADVYAKDIRRDGHKTRFTAVTTDWEYPMEIIIPGVFNVGNALGATAVAYMMGLEPEKIAQAVGMTQVDGHMNIYEKDGYIAIVDYAHNQASIHAAYEALRDYYPDRKIQVVFGCPGCKAFQRRRAMAEESAAFCDYIYITAEDPSYKDPMEVSKEIEEYAVAAGGRCEIIIDRKEAIETAISRLKKDEILIIAGKGSEHYQVVNGIAEPYEGDTVLAKRYIAQK